MSPTLLSRRLKSLEASGLIQRQQVPGSAFVEYWPTKAGLEVEPIIELFGVWGQRWVRSSLADSELDVSLLMWFLRCGIDRKQFKLERSVVCFVFKDRPRLSKGNWWVDKWWLIVSQDEVDLCSRDPGHEVDLFVTSDLRTMTMVSLGHIAVHDAIGNSSIELHGSKSLARAFERWLPRSSFAQVKRPPEPLDLRRALRI